MIFKFSFFLALSLCSFGVSAHDGHTTEGVGFIVGLLHPILGFDHFLAMVSVGILSYQLGGRAIWIVPSTFVLVMTLGGVLGFYDVNIPLIEAGISLSVLVLGIAIATSKKISLLLSLIFVGFFAIFHGHAHGTEMPNLANPYLYALGFVSGTSFIHLLGVSTGLIAGKFSQGYEFLRFIGAGVAGIGLYILISL